MEIHTKFNIGDTVMFIHQDLVRKTVIKNIHVTVEGDEHIANEHSIFKTGEKVISYRVVMPDVVIKENMLFGSAEALVDHIKEEFSRT